MDSTVSTATGWSGLFVAAAPSSPSSSFTSRPSSLFAPFAPGTRLVPRGTVPHGNKRSTLAAQSSVYPKRKRASCSSSSSGTVLRCARVYRQQAKSFAPRLKESARVRRPTVGQHRVLGRSRRLVLAAAAAALTPLLTPRCAPAHLISLLHRGRIWAVCQHPSVHTKGPIRRQAACERNFAHPILTTAAVVTATTAAATTLDI